MAEEGQGLDFPAGFRWGTATAAHQIEGGNTNNDWWAFEHTPGSGCAEPSGDACDSWNRWAEDADLAPSHIPARIPEDLARQVKELAAGAFRALDARGIARVDFLVDRPSMRAYVNEVNTLPGSLCLRLWEASGLAPVQVVRRLLELAVEAHAEKTATRFESEEGRAMVDKKHLMSPRK